MTTTWTFRTLASLVLALAVGVPAAAADYTYTYNEADQLVQAGQVANLNPVSFTYDGDGVRVKRSVESLLPTTETIYVYDAFGNVIAEYDKTGQLLGDYVWVNGQRVCKIAAGEQRTYYHTGPGGSTLALTNDAAQVIGRTDYYPFGSTFASSGTQDRYAFMGKDRDFGLYYFGSRFYDPATATFSSPDPVAGSVERPQGLHRYSYALNNPNKYHDPNGEILDTILDIGFIAYDVYRIVADNVVGQKGNFKENLLALGADVGGACIPFATGGGVALRVAAHTDDVIDGVRLAERGVDAVRAADRVADVQRAVVHGHHPQPKFLGGTSQQALSELDPSIHREYHKPLAGNLDAKGIPLPVGGRGGSAVDWANYMNVNPGA